MASTRPFARAFALALALIQLASPGLAAAADALIQRDAANGPVTHIEATTQAACPAVHSLDCALCRYLSAATDRAAAAQTVEVVVTVRMPRGVHEDAPRSRAPDTPRGRGPPAV